MAGTVDRFVHEVRVLSRLRHPHLILFMGYCTAPEPCIVSEFMARGSLFHILRQRQVLAARQAAEAAGGVSGGGGGFNGVNGRTSMSGGGDACSAAAAAAAGDPRFHRAVAAGVAKGMAYLHSRSPPILHLVGGWGGGWEGGQAGFGTRLGLP